MSSKTPSPSSTDLALKTKNEALKLSEEELQKQPQDASSPEKSMIELVESLYEIAKEPGTAEKKLDQFLDVFTKLEKQGCDVGELKNLLETVKELPPGFANDQTLPSGFQEAFERVDSIGLRMIESAKAGVLDRTLISDVRETKEVFLQFNKHDLGPNILSAIAKGVEKNLNDIIEWVDAEEMRMNAEKIRKLEEKRKEEVRADIKVLFICLYFLCIVVCGVAFVINKFL
ncbi:hypothetical protein ACHQM5_020938 [Ranunculus cassubicifolius]